MVMAAKRKPNRELAEVLHLSDRAAHRRRLGQFPFSFGEIEKVGAWLEIDPETFLTGRGLEDAE